MNTFSSKILAVAVLFFQGFCQWAHANERFKVTSINIRFDCSRYQMCDGPQIWELRKYLLARVLNEVQSDLIATQEGDQKQLLELHRLLPDYEMATAHRNPWKSSFYPTLFLRKGVWQIIETGDLWLSETPQKPLTKLRGSPWPRLVTWARLRHNSSGQVFLFANTHLENTNSHIQESQAKILTNLLNELSTPQLPLILLGDFNAGPQSQTQSIILEGLPQLLDPWPFFFQQERPTYHGYGAYSEWNSQDKRIDWILIDNRLRSVTYKVGRHFMSHAQFEETLYPSDHHPIHLEIETCSHALEGDKDIL